MKKQTIAIVDLAASSGGALSILNQYYEIAIANFNINWVFFLSTPEFNSAKNIKIFNYKWVKRSIIHRIFFEVFILNKLIKKHNPSKVISLQNLIVLFSKYHQIVYVHQALPFSNYKFNLFTNKSLWFYKYIYKYLMFYSIRKAKKIIVQSEWLKEKIISLKLKSNQNIEVKPPLIKLTDFRRDPVKKYSFIYPASHLFYKNHKLIVNALIQIESKFLQKLKFYFTLTGKESKYIETLKQIISKYSLPIYFVGPLKFEILMEYYKNCDLIFPSFIESFGLPLLEAKTYGLNILCSDEPFSKEILKNYNNVHYFNAFDSKSLKNQLLIYCNNVN